MGLGRKDVVGFYKPPDGNAHRPMFTSSLVGGAASSSSTCWTTDACAAHRSGWISSSGGWAAGGPISTARRRSPPTRGLLMHDAMDEFETHRPLLFGIAYRMLGSISDAEDIVQDAYLRYTASLDTLSRLRERYATIVTRLCPNALQSARARRESYVGQ